MLTSAEIVLRHAAETLPDDASQQAILDLIEDIKRLPTPAAARTLEILALRLTELLDARN